MKNIRPFTAFFFTSLLFYCGTLFGQSPVSVNLVTGTADVNIPVYTLSSGQVSIPIYLQYLATGVKTKDVESNAGMNWQLFSGGRLSRTIRGLPDDCTKDSLGNTRLGWMSTSNTGASYATTFVPQNDRSLATCTDETNDINNINNNMPYTEDTEPDIFNVNAPGLSCQLVYDRSTGAFHTVNYQDLLIQISKITAAGNHTGNITSFTIINDKGIKYVFAAPESVTEFTTPPSTGVGTYFKNRYLQYQNGITYSDAWNLISMTDPYGNGVTFTYTTPPARGSNDPVILYIGGSTAQTVQYYVQIVASHADSSPH